MKNYAILFFLNTCANIAGAQDKYSHDRVYTANQVSNSVSVIDPSNDKLLGEIRLGMPYPNVLSPLYRGQALVHGLRYSPEKKMLAAVAIGSNSVVLISTETNEVLKIIYVGRAPHEPTFSPDSKQLWVSVRGEAYISVIDLMSMNEIKRVEVDDGPGMISFSPDGKIAYVCSSFTPELDVVDTKTFKVIKRIPVVSPFSPNIFTSPKGEWVALTHKDVGKITVVDAKTLTVTKVLNTGAITNHVTFTYVAGKLTMIATVGGENKVRIYDVTKDFEQTDTINVGALPHGLWTSADGKKLYVGLEYNDQVQAIDLINKKVISTIPIGQSPQALVYADNAVNDLNNKANLSPLNDTAATLVVPLNLYSGSGHGRLAIRTIGLNSLMEQSFNNLKPDHFYILAITKSEKMPYSADYLINSFYTDEHGKYMGQSTGPVENLDYSADRYHHIVLLDAESKQCVLIN
jgi:YVTN family beta-propeller protein